MRLKGKRAISPLIATVILIAICVAGGLLVYSIFFSTTSTITAKGQVSVEAIDLVKDTDGNAVFSITIKNTGNKPVTDLKVNVNNEGEQSINLDAFPGGLQPGQSVSYINDELTQNYVVGNSYNVVIMATFSDGSTATITTSVRCRSG